MRFWFLVILSGLVIISLNFYKSFEGWGKKAFYPPSPQIKHFALGHQDTMADSFWLRTLQDFGVCDQKQKGQNLTPEGRRYGKNRTPSCNKGWMYHMADLVMELAPRFHLVARTAPLALSVVADDIEGATLLFRKAIYNFPKDWVIKFRAAYHYLIELEDKRTAAELFMSAYKHGAPEWTPLLAAKLQDQLGQTEVADFILTQFLTNELKDEKNRTAASKKLKELKIKQKKAEDSSSSAKSSD